MNHLILSIDDLGIERVLQLTQPTAFGTAWQRPPAGLLALLFQQPSLRTMGSFAAAACQLGLCPMALTTTGDALRDQVDFVDEIRQLALISAAVVVRSKTPLPRDALRGLAVPVVSAGDGSNEHPTQSLVDVAAMRAHGLEHKTVTLMGNLRDHRVHHSLVRVLQQLGVTVQLLHPPGLEMPAQHLRGPLRAFAATSEEEVDTVLATTDFLYLAPVQYWNAPERQAGRAFRLDLARATRVLRAGARIFHPFPRHEELDPDLDHSAFDGYHAQTARAPEIRRRLLGWLLAN